MGDYIDGWKLIAERIGRSDRTARKLARATDPLPVFKVGGIVRLNLADLERWLERQRATTMRRPAEIAPAIEEHW